MLSHARCLYENTDIPSCFPHSSQEVELKCHWLDVRRFSTLTMNTILIHDYFCATKYGKAFPKTQSNSYQTYDNLLRISVKSIGIKRNFCYNRNTTSGYLRFFDWTRGCCVEYTKCLIRRLCWFAMNCGLAMNRICNHVILFGNTIKQFWDSMRKSKGLNCRRPVQDVKIFINLRTSSKLFM